MLDQYISNDLTIFGARVAAVIDACLTICALFIRKSNQQQSKVQCMKVVCCCLSQHDLEPLVVTVQTCHIVGRLVTCIWADCLSRSKHILQVSRWNHVSTADVVDGDMPRLPGPRKKAEYILHLLNHGSFLPPKILHTSSWEKPDMCLTENISKHHMPAWMHFLHMAGFFLPP